MSQLADMFLPTFPEQDYVTLGGEQFPGYSEVRGAGSPRNWDIRKGYGFSGATVVFMGDGLAKFDVVVTLWDPAQWKEWQAFAKKFLGKPPRAGVLSIGSPLTVPIKALKIGHPILNAAPLYIEDVVVEDVSQFEQDEFGQWTCTVSFLQYRAPVPMLGKPNAAIPPLTKVPVPAAKTASEIALEKSRAEFAKAQGGG